MSERQVCLYVVYRLTSLMKRRDAQSIERRWRRSYDGVCFRFG